MNCHNSRTSKDIDTKLRSITKYVKRNKKHQKNRNYVMAASCDVIAIFSIYNQIGAIRKPDSGCIVSM